MGGGKLIGGRPLRRGGARGPVAVVTIVGFLLVSAGTDRGADRRAPVIGADGSGARPSVSARVVRAIDGDTVEVRMASGALETVRYIGIDTPETVDPGTPPQCGGAAASHANAEMVEGRMVRLRFDAELRDAYGRLLAYVYAGRQFANLALVRRGLARTLEIEPNTSFAPALAGHERAAARRGRGIWGKC